MSVKYKLVKDTRASSPNNGKWSARAVVTNVVDADELAERIQRMNTVTKSDVFAVLNSLFEVMCDELANGSRIVLDGIGSFKVGMKTTYADTPEEWTPTRHLKGCKIIFRPETIDTRVNGTRTRSAKLLRDIKFEELSLYNRDGTDSGE